MRWHRVNKDAGLPHLRHAVLRFVGTAIVPIFVFLALPICRGHAAEIAIENSSIVIKGKLSRGDFVIFEKSIDLRYKTNQVIFENCLGGYVDEGVKIGELIRSKGLSTVAKGQVQSSCAYAYLAGGSRKFDEGFGVDLILLHATRNEDAEKDVASRANLALIPYLQILSGGRLKPEILELIARSTMPSQGVVFVHENWFFLNREKVLYCDGAQHRGLEKCTLLPHSDAFREGIVTHRK